MSQMPVYFKIRASFRSISQAEASSQTRAQLKWELAFELFRDQALNNTLAFHIRASFRALSRQGVGSFTIRANSGIGLGYDWEANLSYFLGYFACQEITQTSDYFKLEKFSGYLASMRKIIR